MINSVFYTVFYFHSSKILYMHIFRSATHTLVNLKCNQVLYQCSLHIAEFLVSMLDTQVTKQTVSP